MKRTSIVHAAAIVLAAIIATPAMAGDIKVGGKIFFDYGSKSVTQAAKNAGKKTTTTGGNLTRTYLSAKTKIDDTWSVKLTLDSAYDKTGTSKRTQVFVKKAQLTGKFMPEANVKFGVIGTPWVGYEDKLGKHRYISKSFVDIQGLDSSADAGIGFFGKAADGMVHYDVALVNGKGYGDTARTGAQDFNARIGTSPIEGLTIDFGYRNGYMGGKATTQTVTTGLKKYTLTQIMATYSMDDTFRVGVNMINDKVTNAVGTASATLKGLDAWGWMKFSDNLGAFVNYETAKTGEIATIGKMTGAATEATTVVSVDYKANKKVLISLASTSISNLHGVNGDKETIFGIYSQYKF